MFVWYKTTNRAFAYIFAKAKDAGSIAHAKNEHYTRKNMLQYCCKNNYSTQVDSSQPQYIRS
jgi:hypothetical protein